MFIKQLQGTWLKAPVPTWLFSGMLGCLTSEKACCLGSRGGGPGAGTPLAGAPIMGARLPGSPALFPGPGSVDAVSVLRSAVQTRKRALQHTASGRLGAGVCGSSPARRSLEVLTPVSPVRKRAGLLRPSSG